MKTSRCVCEANSFLAVCSLSLSEDCMWVLCLSPSLPLLQLLTEPQASILSVGVACCSLLADPERRELAVQLLDRYVSRERVENTESNHNWTGRT